MKKLLKNLVLVTFFFTAVSTFGQTMKEYQSQSIDIDKLPEYVVIALETNGRILGPRNIFVNARRSPYEDALKELQDVISDRKKLNVRTQTDLLNAMLGFGFEYKDAYGPRTGLMVHIVFRKQEKYRKTE
jgi:hypothetical protein